MIASVLISPLVALLAAADPAPAAPAAAPPTQTVEVTGEASATSFGGDMAAAKEAARNDAFRNAVEQVGGTMVSGLSVTKDSTLVTDRIFAKSSGYIKHWSYVGEPEIDGSSVKVKIKADVGTTELNADLEAIKAMIEMKNKPRVVLLIAEQNVGMSEPFAWWSKGQKDAKGDLVAIDLGTFENSMINDLKPHGWTFIDHDALEGKIKTHAAFTSDLSANQAIEFGKLSSAQVAIVGRVVATSLGQSEMAPPGMTAATAQVSLRALNCDTGEILGTFSDPGVQGGIGLLDVSAAGAGQKIMQFAAAKAAEKIEAKILEHWQSSNRITMKVSGVPSYRVLQDLEGQLSSMAGVKELAERNADGAEAEIDLDYKDGARLFAKKIDGKTVKGKTVNVKHVSANEVDVAFGK